MGLLGLLEPSDPNPKLAAVEVQVDVATTVATVGTVDEQAERAAARCR